MAIFAVLIPIVMLVVLVGMGRYEELMLSPPPDEPEESGDAAPAPGQESAVASAPAPGGELPPNV